MKQVMLDTPFKHRLQQQWMPINTLASFSAVGITPMQALPSEGITKSLITPDLSGNLKPENINNKVGEQVNSLNSSTAEKAKKTQAFTNGLNKVGNLAGQLSQLIPVDYSGQYGSLMQGANTAYDSIANWASTVNPIAGNILKIGGFANKGLNALGVNTDNMTSTDAILGSSFLGLTPIGLANSIGAKRSNNFYMDNDAMANVGGSYQASAGLFEDAKTKANKKYGLFSSGARHRANDLIDKAQQQMNTISRISDTANRVLALDGMANYQKYQLSQNGGPQAMYIAAKGTKLRIKSVCNKVHKKLKGGRIKPKPFVPVITLTETIKFQKGGNIKPSYEQWVKTVPSSRIDTLYDLQTAYKVLPFEILESWRTATDQELKEGAKHLKSVNPNPDANGNLWFLKLGTLEKNPELKNEFDWYNSNDASDFRKEYAPAQFDKTTNRYFYPKKYENGGAVSIKITVVKNLEEPKKEDTSEKNVIPEGALHAHKHHIENSDSLTSKGIPVVDDKGEQQAEIERDELILNLKLTTKLEELQKEYEQASKTEQDKLALEAGKILVEEILHNTIDNTGLIDKCEKGGKINEPK